MKQVVSPIIKLDFPPQGPHGPQDPPKTPTFWQGRTSAHAQAAFQHPSIATEVLVISQPQWAEMGE